MAEGLDASNDEGPGSIYKVFTNMESVMENLKILDYEKNYCKPFHMKPISRHYFALPTNPGEQFNAFISLSAWLVRECGYDMDQPQDYDDPNASIATVLQAVRQISDTVSISPNKLKSGCGESIVMVLLILSNYILKKRGFIWSLPRYVDEKEVENENIIDEDVNENSDNDEFGFDNKFNNDDLDDDDEEENMLDLEGLNRLNFKNQSSTDFDKTNEYIKPEGIIESSVNSAEWLLEVERVLPQLKVTIRNESRDWRTHQDQMHQNQADLKKCYDETRPHLDRLFDELNKSVEKISTREKYLNNQVEHQLSDYRLAQESLVVARGKRKEAGGGINQRTKILAELTEELDRVKQQMEERGTNMSDGLPVTRIRQAMQKLKTEMKQMLIRSGLLEHLLLQETLKAKSDIRPFEYA